MLAFPGLDTKCASTPVLAMDDDAAPVTRESAELGGALPLAVLCVRALMERHGLPKYRQSPWLADALGLSYSQAHRRMTGASPWTLEDLAKVAALFGETLPDVVSHVQPRTSVSGVMNVGDARLPCELWIGDPLEAPRPDAVVAVKTSSGWSAVPAKEAEGLSLIHI